MRTAILLLFIPMLATAETPVGEVLKFTFDKSKIFPGTTREYWVYIPKQYDGKTPACVHINQDGIQFGAAKDGKTAGVFDKLIEEKKMPVTIGVFIRPGEVKALSPNALNRYNRSFEYDGLGDGYARFLLEELLPDVETKTASDGRKIVLSKSGNDRSIGGSSSGAICAFTAAWERPQEFSRVFSSIGTYVGLRGGNEYPTLIRKVEPKPLRIYLEDGLNDLNIYGGDWWMANQSMERSLKFMGYELEHKWGDGGHNGKHATEIFPEAMTWLWKDYPNPVKAGAGSPDYKDLFIPGEGWKLAFDGVEQIRGLTSNAKGDVYLIHKADCTISIINDGKLDAWMTNSPCNAIFCFDGDGKLYGSPKVNRGLSVIDTDRKDKEIANTLHCHELLALHNGRRYTIANTDGKFGTLYSLDAKDVVVPLAVEDHPSALATSPDQSLLYVATGQSQFVWSYQIQADGSLRYGQAYYHLHRADDATPNVTAMQCDRYGNLWVATAMGFQICDQAGRVHCIIPSPGQFITGFCFGGPEFNVLYCTCGDKVYRRKVKVQGALPFAAPVKPEKPRL